MRDQLALAAVMLATAFTAGAGPAQAQTLKDRLKGEVREGIEKSREKRSRDEAEGEGEGKGEAPAQSEPPPAEPPPPPAPAPKREPARERPEGTTLFSFGTDSEEPEAEAEKKPEGPALPFRVLGEDLKLDLNLGGGYRGWVPQQYDAVDVEVGGYFTWSIDVKAKLFKFLNIHQGYYESNGLSGPRTDEAAVAAQIGSYAPKAAWLLGVVGIPISRVWEPVIRYESRAFDTRATPRMPVCIVARGASENTMDCPTTTDPLRITSGFETFVAGVKYDHSRESSAVVQKRKSKIPPVYFGVGLIQYRKPYQITIDGTTVDEFLFDGRFRGAGIAGGSQIDRGINQFYGKVNLQLGIGEVSLTRDLTLNELAPEDWLIGYVAGDLTVGYRWSFLDGPPTLILIPQVTGGGASFFFFETQRKEGEQGTTPPVNWDFLWMAQVALLIPL